MSPLDHLYDDAIIWICKAISKDICYPDVDVFDHVVTGRPIIGDLPESKVFVYRELPGSLSQNT